MKTIKFIITFLILIIIGLFNTRVNASEINYEEIINNLPDTIEIDYSKSETIEQKMLTFSVPEGYEVIKISQSTFNGVVTKIRVGLKYKNDASVIYLAQKDINVTYSCDLLKKILKLLPNKMELDIPEIEYEKASSIVKENLNKIIEENGISQEELDNQKIKIYSSVFLIDMNMKESIRKASIRIEYNGCTAYNGDMDVIYNNHNEYNEKDEEYIKTLNIKNNKYYEVSLSWLADNKYDYNNFLNIIQKKYEEQIGDNSITVKAYSGAGSSEGGINFWTLEAGTIIAIFKNEILYDVRVMGCECTVPFINIPSTISEENIDNYVVEEISKYYKDFGSNIYEIIKGTNNLNITDGYTVKSKKAGRDNYIILKRNTKTKLIDNNSGVKLDANVEVVPEDAELVVKKILDGKEYDNIKEILKNKTNNFIAYDISLMKNNVNIQPNGKFKLSLPIPTEYDTSKLILYSIIDNSEIEYEISKEDGFAIFETDNLSTYVLAEKTNNSNEEEKINEKSDKENNIDKNTDIEHKLDDTPKTGNVDIIVVITSILSIISSVGIFIVKRL